MSPATQLGTGSPAATTDPSPGNSDKAQSHHREPVAPLPALPQALSSPLDSPPCPGGGDSQRPRSQAPATQGAELPPAAGREGSTEIPVLPAGQRKASPFQDLEQVLLTKHPVRTLKKRKPAENRAVDPQDFLCSSSSSPSNSNHTHQGVTVRAAQGWQGDPRITGPSAALTRPRRLTSKGRLPDLATQAGPGETTRPRKSRPVFVAANLNHPGWDLSFAPPAASLAGSVGLTSPASPHSFLLAKLNPLSLWTFV